MAFLLLFVLPLTYFAFAFEHAANKKWRPLLLSLVSVLICFPVYAWGVLQSRSSTAAIALVFIPIFACTCGLLTFGFFYARAKANTVFNALAGLCVVGILVVYGFGVYAGLSEKKINDDKDQLVREISAQTRWINEHLPTHQGNENDWLRQELETHKDNLGFQVAAVRSAFIEDSLLSILASETTSRDLLSAIIIHKNTSPATLESIFKAHGIDDKLDVSFSMNSKTPTSILDKIFSRSSFTDQWLASNLNTSQVTLKKIASFKKMHTLVPLSQRSDLECSSLKNMREVLSDKSIFDAEGVREETLSRVINRIASQCSSQ